MLSQTYFHCNHKSIYTQLFGNWRYKTLLPQKEKQLTSISLYLSFNSLDMLRDFIQPFITLE